MVALIWGIVIVLTIGIINFPKRKTLIELVEEEEYERRLKVDTIIYLDSESEWNYWSVSQPTFDIAIEIAKAKWL